MNKSIKKLDLSAYSNNNVCWYNFNRFNNIKELIVNVTLNKIDTLTIWKFPINELEYDFPQVSSLKIIFTDPPVATRHMTYYHYYCSKLEII